MNQEWKQVADVLRTRGWIQGDWSGEDGVCLLGACGIAWHDDASYFEVGDTGDLDEFRVGLLGGEIISAGYEYDEHYAWQAGMELVVAFNDYPDRTKNEVLAVVDGLANRVLNDFA